MRYIIRYVDLHSFNTTTNKREAFRHARACARDHRGASVHVDNQDSGWGRVGDCLAAWNADGKRVVVATR